MTANPSSENPIAAASTPDVRGSGLSVASGSAQRDRLAKEAESFGWMRCERLGKEVWYDPTGGHVTWEDLPEAIRAYAEESSHSSAALVTRLRAIADDERYTIDDDGWSADVLRQSANKLEAMQAALQAVRDWYDRDDSVGGLENVMEDFVEPLTTSSLPNIAAQTQPPKT